MRRVWSVTDGVGVAHGEFSPFEVSCPGELDPRTMGEILGSLYDEAEPGPPTSVGFDESLDSDGAAWDEPSRWRVGPAQLERLSDGPRRWGAAGRRRVVTPTCDALIALSQYRRTLCGRRATWRGFFGDWRCDLHVPRGRHGWRKVLEGDKTND